MSYDLFLYKFGLNIFPWGISSYLLQGFFLCFAWGKPEYYQYWSNRSKGDFVYICNGLVLLEECWKKCEFLVVPTHWIDKFEVKYKTKSTYENLFCKSGLKNIWMCSKYKITHGHIKSYYYSEQFNHMKTKWQNLRKRRVLQHKMARIVHHKMPRIVLPVRDPIRLPVAK